MAEYLFFEGCFEAYSLAFYESIRVRKTDDSKWLRNYRLFTYTIYTKLFSRKVKEFFIQKYGLSLTEYLSSVSAPLIFLHHLKQVSLKINTLLKASFTVEIIKKGTNITKTLPSTTNQM